MKRIQRYDQVAIYHCLSRVVHGERLLDEQGKAVFCKILRRVAGFCGVRVLTYCVMSNHFHLLVEVPSRELREQLTDAQLVHRFRLLYGEEGNCYMPITAEDLESVLAAGGAVARGWRECLQSRMNDLPMFMKLLKQRFTRWYNKTYETYGTFWSERYASLLLEPESKLLRKVACYIDLNPVRAGLVDDPARYAWSGFGAASMGDRKQRASLIYLAAYGRAAGDDDFKYYLAELYQRGSLSMKIRGKEGFIPAEVVERVLQKRIAGEQPTPFAKEFSDWLSKGIVFGSKRFLESQIPWVSQLLGWRSQASIKQRDSTEAILNRRLN